jgi:hemolysin activation/secretion protein
MQLKYCLWGVLIPWMTGASVWAGEIPLSVTSDSASRSAKSDIKGNAAGDSATSTSTSAIQTASKMAKTADVDEIFAPYLDRIQQSLPPQWVMRLPAPMPLSRGQKATLPNAQVQVAQSITPPRLTVNLVNCRSGETDCLLGSFAAEPSTSAAAQVALQQHQLAASPITLGNGMQGYLWAGERHQQAVSSVMWVQDGMIYTVSFPHHERQNLLYAAVYMANAQPITAPAPAPGTEPVSPSTKALPPAPTAPPSAVAAGLTTAPASSRQTVPRVRQAQNSPPDRDRFLQSPSPPQPLPNEQPVLPLAPPTPVESSPPPTENLPPIPVRRIAVVDSRILTPPEIAAIKNSLEGKTVPFEKLTQATDQITKYYLDRGYITSRAVLLPQTPEDAKNGVVRIRVIEGELEKITVEGTQRLEAYVRDRVARGVTTPLNARKLEDQLRLLLIDPLFKNVVPTLQAGSGEGKSILMVRVIEAPPFNGSVDFDNLSPPSVGSERVGVNLRYRNLAGLGDEVSAAHYRTFTGGSKITSFAYRVPLNSMEGSLQIGVDINRNRITQSPFDQLDIQGASEQYQISYRQPLVRSPQQEFALSFGFAFQNGQTFIFDNLPTPFGIGPDANGVSRTSVFKFGQDYVARDPKGAWSVRSQFSFGTGLFDATSNPAPIPDGRFFSWLGQAQRVQRLSEGQLLITQLDLQLTPNSLLPSQQFVLGGGQSVRGYRQNARTGDNGVRFSVEDRVTLQRDKGGTPTLLVTPFIDLGAVWNVADNPNRLPRQTFLMGAGVGVLWQPWPGLNLRLDYGLPLIDLSDRGNNLQDNGWYFTVDYQF